jgi:hypothetical protein
VTRSIAFTLFVSLLSVVLSVTTSSGQDGRSPARTIAQDIGRTDGFGIANPSVGMGLNGIVDWTAQQPFVDVMKTARPWTGHLPNQWGGWGPEDFASRGYLDEDGWLKSIPEGITSVSTLILTDLPPKAVSVNGRYRMTYRGQGVISLGGRARNVKRENDAIWFDFVAGPGFVEITIRKTDPLGTGDYIRDIQVVKKENIPLHEVGALFNPDWIERIQDQRLLRFMDWMNTNDSTISEWSQRPKTSDFTYVRRGAPMEIMVALANQIGADPWFTMPHLATDEYMRRFAEYVRDNLDPALKAHVEFSNEVWNWQFQQAQWAEAEGRKRWGQDSKWVEFYGMRAAQMARIWDEVFGNQSSERLVKVISTQTGWLGLEEGILDTPLWVAEDPSKNHPAAAYFDAYAITGYFAGGLGGDAKAPTVKTWIERSRAAALAEAQRQNLAEPAKAAYLEEHAYDAAVALAAQELRDGSLTGDRQDTLGELVGKVFPYHRDVATRHGLDLIMYEGGTHIAASGAWVDDPDLTPFFIHLNYTPEMGVLYEILLKGWKDAGGTLFNAFVDVSAPSKWGSWGALRHLWDQNPRWDALSAFNMQTPGWWETRKSDAFLHGVTKFAAAGEDRINGTAKADILIGSDSNDVLVGAGGSDRLHGGAGNDTAILPGHFEDYIFQREGELLTARSGQMVTTLYSVETLMFSDDPDRRVQAGEIR